MAKKKRMSGSSQLRYTGKLAQLFEARVGDKQLAQQIAHAANVSRASGYQKYVEAWEVAKGILIANKIPTAVWGLYRSFTFQLINSVRVKGLSAMSVIEKWSKVLNINMMYQICDALEIPVEKPATSPPATAPKQ